MIYRIIAALTLVALIVGSMLLGAPHEHTLPTQAASREVPHETEGYAARHARLIQTGPDGHPLYTVDAEDIRQRPDEGTVELETVKVGFRDETGNLWKAWGDHGRLGQATGQVDLQGNVRVAGLLPGTTDEAHMATERLHVDTQAQVMHTQDPVVMSTSDQRNRLQSRGLFANLKSGHVFFRSAVHGTYIP
jgi:LPS export ABC transporter protein LptC